VHDSARWRYEMEPIRFPLAHIILLEFSFSPSNQIIARFIA
jgi:hypothetical protein